MNLLRKLLLLGATATAACAVSAAELPTYLRDALAQFSSDAPRGWAYSLTTTRGDETTVERYDPSRPKGGEWTLLRRNGNAPSADDLQSYLRYRASNAPGTARASFEKGDIDTASLQLVEERVDSAVFRGNFRDTKREPILAHLGLTLTVDRTHSLITDATMELATPFSPALGMKMNLLRLRVTFAPPQGDLPALPREVRSEFRGRAFFLVPIEEDLRVTYSDWQRVTPAKRE